MNKSVPTTPYLDQKPGTSGPSKSGGDGKFAEGGKTAMFGNSGSQPALAGRTSR